MQMLERNKPLSDWSYDSLQRVERMLDTTQVAKNLPLNRPGPGKSDNIVLLKDCGVRRTPKNMCLHSSFCLTLPSSEKLPSAVNGSKYRGSQLDHV